MIRSARNLMAGALLALPLAAFAAPVVYVNDDWAGLDNGDPVNVEAPLPVGTATFGTDAFASIIDAVDAVDADGIVWVAPGTYAEGAPIVIDKNLEMRGANYGVNPNTSDETPASRNAESILLAHTNASGPSDWGVGGNIVRVTGGDVTEVVFDGFLLEGFNPALPDDPEITGLGGDPLGSNAGFFSDAGNVETITFANNIVQNFTQWPYRAGGGYTIAHDNRVLNSGVPFILGFGRAFVQTGTDGYAHIHDNFVQHCRSGFQAQGQNTAAPSRPAIIENNRILDVEAHGVFLNLISGTANDFTIRDNTIRGLGPDVSEALANGGVYLSAQNGNRNHNITNNHISDFIAGYFFLGGSATNVVTGGTVENVGYGAVFTNRLGYRGIADYQSSGSESDAAIGRDGTGGWALFMSETAFAAVPESGFTGEIALPDPLDDATGQTAFAESDFTGKIALLERGGDPSLAAFNAEAAGAIGVIIAQTNNLPPLRPISEGAHSSIDIPVTSIDQADANVIRNDINVNGNTVEVTLYPWDFPSETLGLNAPGVFTSSTNVDIVGVKFSDAKIAGFGLVDIPNELGTGSTPGATNGRILGGSSITGSAFGALIVGEKADLTAQSVKFNSNEVGARIVGGQLEASALNVSDNTDAGVRITGDTATATILDSNFDDQALGIEVSDNPDGVVVSGTSFWDTTSRAIENLSIAEGTVMAQGNWWGAADGPDDDAGIINGSGASISEGVDASDFLASPSLVPATDFFTDTLGNGLPDWLEVLLGYDPTDPADPNRAADTAGLTPQDWEDPDGDNLPNWVEDILGTDPNDPDTDGDGIRDDYELFRGTNPLNPNSFPPFGDANFDGEADITDALDIFRVFLGLQDFTTINPVESDINLDGTVDNVDGVILINWLLDNVEVIPFGDQAP